MSSVKVIKSPEEFNQILKEAGDKLVVVDFTATWCGPCKAIAPKFDGLAKDNANVVFLKVDVDDVPDLSEQCTINCMPTFQFYKNGEKIFEFSGANVDTLIEKVKALQ